MAKKYWKTLEEKAGDKDILDRHVDEFGDSAAETRYALAADQADSSGMDRAEFLKLSGFGLAISFLAGCRDKIGKIVPYLERPQTITPGVSYQYASTAPYPYGTGVLVTNREGRPVKIEGNPGHPLSGGATSAPTQSDLLDLYDKKKHQGPKIGNLAVSWKRADDSVFNALVDLRKRNANVRVISGTVNSPTLLHTIERFLKTFKNGRHVQYDALSVSALADSYERSHAKRMVPHYRFDLADVILSIDADFLGTWISPVEYARDWAKGRKINSKRAFSQHIQIETRMSSTGGKADERIPLSPSEIPAVLGRLVQLIAGSAAPASAGGLGKPVVNDAKLEKIARILKNAGHRSLVVCGINDPGLQDLVNWLNHRLGAEGNTVELNRPSMQRMGNDADLATFVKELNGGKLDAVFVLNANPVYDLPSGDKIAQALGNLTVSVCLNPSADETSLACKVVAPDAHWLESWGDAEGVKGWISTIQPTIQKTADTREAVESFARWGGRDQSAAEIVAEYWKDNIHPQNGHGRSFQKFWDDSLSQGIVIAAGSRTPSRNSNSLRKISVAKSAKLSLVLYPKVSILDGRLADNAWLQEMPDPISKISWDNYAAMNLRTAEKMGITERDVIEVTAGDQVVTLPVHLQPGTPAGVVAVALGYGRNTTGRFHTIGPKYLESVPTIKKGETVGVRVSGLQTWKDGYLSSQGAAVTVKKTGATQVLAQTQKYNSLFVPSKLAPEGMARRDVVLETNVEEYKNGGGLPHKHEDKSLYSPHTYPLHHWGMSVDMTACNGCSACVVACQVENNIPVVGKDEVEKHRDMYWLRIDRYFADVEHSDGENIDLAYQPMMCQHCDNAPCEPVCPPGATQHSDEGLNEMVYNRCIGTRYCANNCPYKVRRFNWFSYEAVEPEFEQVFNPEVTVRSRGVMEKCTFCVQRIESVRADSKREGRDMKDGEIKTACQQVCPTEAIVFGDTADKNSRVTKLQDEDLAYEVLEEVNVKSSVRYKTLVRNPLDRPKAEKKGAHHG